MVAGQLAILSAAAAGWVLSGRQASILREVKMELIAVGGEAVRNLVGDKEMGGCGCGCGCVVEVVDVHQVWCCIVKVRDQGSAGAKVAGQADDWGVGIAAT